MKKNQKINQANHPEELLYLVDSNDKVLGSVVRKIANADPSKSHREVGIIIVDDQKRVLLQQRSKYKKVNPLCWSITAGHITYGKEPLESAYEELNEELGFETKLIYLNKELHTYDWETHFMYYYMGFYDNQKITIDKSEIKQVKMFDYESLKELTKVQEVNHSHFPTFNKLWKGDYNRIYEKLKKQKR